MSYTLHVGEFQGPLEKLLELIEAKKLDITTVSLAEVTNDFIAYVKSLEKTETRTLADFVSVAARLMLIKSKSLLPTLELTEHEEADINEFQKKLELYQLVRNATQTLREVWNKNTILYSRTLFLGMDSYIRQETKVALSDVASAMQKIIRDVAVCTHEKRQVKKTLRTLEQTIQHIIERIRASGSKNFSALHDGKNKIDIILVFLALLHLAKLGNIQINQTKAFDDMMVNSC